MRNLKRALSLALASVMLLGMMVVGTGASYADVSSEDNKEAIEFLQSLSVMSGDDNGNFNPDQVVTRAEMTVIICKMLYGDKLNVAPFVGADTFNDVPAWAQGFVNLCASQGIVGGVGDGKFDPNSPVTTAQAALMLCRALGYFQTDAEFAQGWMLAATERGTKIGLYEDLGNLSATAGLTRNDVAQMAYNAMTIATPVQYNKLIEDYSTVGTSGLSGNVVRGDTPGNFQYTLAGTVFSMEKEVGYVTDADYNESTGKYTYTVNVDEDVTSPVDGVNITNIDVTTAQELNASIGLYVEVLYKTNTDGTKSAYGLNSKGVEVSATVGDLDLGTGADATDKKVKISDVEYKLEVAENLTPVYTFVNGTIAANGDLADAFDPASALTLVDDDKDGKYDYALVTPASVAKVTYVGSKTITAGASYTFEDNTIESGLAKDDFVKIIAADNTVYDKAVITKVGTVEGKITAMKGTDIQLDGSVWYEQAVDSGDEPAVGNTVALTVIGGYHYNVKTINGKTLDNVLMILKAADNTGVNDGVEAKVMYAKDGTIATLSNISKVDNVAAVAVSNADYVTELTPTDNGDDYTDAGNVIVGAMYTYKEKDGAIELTTLDDNVIGSMSFTTGKTAFVNSTTKPTVAGKVIADDAIVMAYYDNGTGTTKSAYISGKELKSWDGAFGDTAQVLSEKVNGVDTAKVVVLYDAGTTIPGDTGSTGYGYVIADTYYVEDEDGTGYAQMTIWTADGQISVKAEGHNGSTNTAPTAALVKTEAEYQKGAFITYQKLSNGNIAEVNTIGTAYAMLGSYVNLDDQTVLTLDADGNATAGSGDAIITKDTVIIYVDTDKKTGAEGGSLTLATETAIDDMYVLNIMAAGVTDLDGDADDELDVIFVDVNNNLASNAGSVTPATGTNITSVTAGDDRNELIIASGGKTGTVVATEAASWTGALSAQVIDNTGAVRTDSAVVATDTLRVVAEDGTVYTYVINSIAT